MSIDADIELMIPPEKRAAVSRGVQQAFGTATIDNIRRITAGLSSDLVFRVVVNGSPYLLRIMTRIDERMDPERIFACMRAASDGGLTPSVRYSNTTDAVSITEFVEAVPFAASRALLELPALLRRLHGLPPFPKTFNYVTAHNFFIWRLRKAGLLPPSEVAEIFASYEELCAVYPRFDADMVSCHMDLKPENMLFDGHRVWLVDWQAAFVNDRYFDLAVAANFVVTNDAEEGSYLERYFGRQPDEYEQARFFLMRQMVHMLSAAVFLLLGSGGRPAGVRDDLPSFSDFHARIWAGGVNLADNDCKVLCGLVHWRELRKNAPGPRFAESLRVIGERKGDLLLPRSAA